MANVAATPRYHRRRWGNRVATVLSIGAAAFGLTWLVLILLVLVVKGVGGLTPAVFTEMTPPPGGAGGLLNPIIGSLILTILAVLIGTPLGMLAGTYMAEYGRYSKLTMVVRFINDILLARLRSSSACSSTRSWWRRWGISPPGPAPWRSP